MNFCTDSIIFNILLFLFGLVALLKGSDWFIDAAGATARKLKVSDLIIGLTMVSMGTSLPELATNIYAAFRQEGSIVTGNIVGSNITNSLLILGAGICLLSSISVPRMLFRRDGIIMAAATVGFCVMAYSGDSVGRFSGIILLVSFIWYMVFLIRTDQLAEQDGSDAETKFKSLSSALFFAALGLIMVFGGAKLLVDNVVWTAQRLRLDQAAIAVTVIALGTSLPELAVTVAGVIKKKHAIALGNIFGSNIFNILLIMGVSTVICPAPVTAEMRTFNLPVLLCSCAMLLIFMRTGWRLRRLEGVCLLIGYGAFLCYNIIKMKM